jgi:hypothetical protein
VGQESSPKPIPMSPGPRKEAAGQLEKETRAPSVAPASLSRERKTDFESAGAFQSTIKLAGFRAWRAGRAGLPGGRARRTVFAARPSVPRAKRRSAIRASYSSPAGHCRARAWRAKRLKRQRQRIRASKASSGHAPSGLSRTSRRVPQMFLLKALLFRERVLWPFRSARWLRWSRRPSPVLCPPRKRPRRMSRARAAACPHSSSSCRSAVRRK